MYSVDILSKKWNPHILYLLYHETNQGYSELKRSIDGISSKMLSDCLQNLENEGLVEKVNVENGKQRVEYSLTQKGEDFEMAIRSLYSWGKIYSNDPSKVLLVDDNNWVVEMHDKWIGDTYDTVKAFNSREAIKKCDRAVDIAIIDRRLPEKSGNEVARQLREEYTDLLILMVTAIEPEEDIMPLEFDNYLVKPISEEDLKDSVSQLIHRKHLNDVQRRLMSLASKKDLLEEYYGSNCDELDTYSEITSEIAELKKKSNVAEEQIEDIEEFAST
jgi:DNA-binding HxlR family transcriptional regulator/DNA-binding NarL/FixJ family response regulator